MTAAAVLTRPWGPLAWLILAMSALADYAETTLLDWLFDSSATPTRPTTTTVHLHTGDPGEAGSANEVQLANWDNYAAQTVNNDGATAPFWDRTASTVSNSADVDFGTASIPGADVTVSHVTVRDQGGNVLFQGALAASKTVSNGDPVKFATGELDLSLD